MSYYHKIQTIYKRDEKTHKIMEGDYSMPEFDVLKDIQWYFTEKVDGTNICVNFDGSDVTFGGRNETSNPPLTLLNKLREMFTPAKFESVFGDAEAYDVTLFGEGYGNKIQKGGENYIATGVDFVLFDVVVNGLFLERKNVEDIAQKLGIHAVPIIGDGPLLKAVDMVRAGFDSQWGKFPAEGIVARPRTELFTRRGERIITKIKHRDFTE